MSRFSFHEDPEGMITQAVAPSIRYCITMVDPLSAIKQGESGRSLDKRLHYVRMRLNGGPRKQEQAGRPSFCKPSIWNLAVLPNFSIDHS